MLDVGTAAALPVGEVLARLGSGAGGLSEAEAARRLATTGPNALRTHRARRLAVLARQLRSPLLVLLAVTAAASFFLGERSDALIIGIILAASVGLGFLNEYRAEKAAEALHSQIRHRCLARRDGHPRLVDVTTLVPGDVVELRLGDVVPADLRLVSVTELECDESVLTGESMPVAKTVEAVGAGAAPAELCGCALMGSVVHAGSGTGVVVATAARTEFGRIALQLGERHPETEFQVGLRRFSMLLVRVAAALTVAIFVINLVLDRPVLDALLFSLAIAVGISPQLLPAVVSTSLAAGTRRLAQHRVLVKRLVCIEDLGDIEVLFTDKTGTLTEGRISFMRSLGPDGRPADDVLELGLLCNEAVVERPAEGQEGGPAHVAGGNPLDVALWEAPAAGVLRSAPARYRRLAAVPFDHERRTASVLVEDDDGRRVIITKGAPEAVLERSSPIGDEARAMLEAEFAAGNRVVAVATRDLRDPADARRTTLGPADERDLTFRGLLVFLDPPKAGAPHALERLTGLGVTVKVLTGDNPTVAAKLCADLGLPGGRVLTGQDVEAADDDRLAALIEQSTVFARVTPEHKARIVRVQRRGGLDVAFLGDGVNDVLALHAADVGISVEAATDVAKDAADVLLLEKNLDILADGVLQGRQIFGNTMKYVLMGTSSNFGNMFSAAAASAFLPFLPMLPSQILLNNLLYDSSQLAIPTDTVDPEQLRRPSRWDVGLIRRFMLFFGPISSLFDFATFAVMLGLFQAGPPLFRTGWFVESLATQVLVVFAIRTRRVPFFRSRPSVPLLLAALGVVTVGALIPATPFAAALGFQPLPGPFFVVLGLMVAAYLVLIECGKRWFYRGVPVAPAARERTPAHRTHRRAHRFTTAAALPPEGRRR
ncbi:Magnesium-transporting ATPase, P-type 1 [Nonomuraea coxensis DSM 45129]|uniref:Magnesium-transporting ATPase, P-type 1 n=1 Tax=Nonomuraea coxensis DSM 45129 TaxID=1122611 RepID=A0ABX8TWK8_9ACTN|nr:magnesium-translocating P-type ATPase [Nonomuraea coxensis]QYC39885.1 Magnesium-transporting ATPase, P-type 1 [Nonomuraea coxensis DSM 45129]